MSTDPFRETYDYAFLRLENVQYDTALGRWTVRADPTIAIGWLVAFVVCCLLPLFPGAPVVWGLSASGVIALTLGFTVLYHRHEERTWDLEVRPDSIRLADESIPWAEVDGFAAVTLSVLGLTRQPLMELTGLVVERGGVKRVYPTRTGFDEIERLATRLQTARAQALELDPEDREQLAALEALASRETGSRSRRHE